MLLRSHWCDMGITDTWKTQSWIFTYCTLTLYFYLFHIQFTSIVCASICTCTHTCVYVCVCACMHKHDPRCRACVWRSGRNLRWCLCLPTRDGVTVLFLSCILQAWELSEDSSVSTSHLPTAALGLQARMLCVSCFYMAPGDLNSGLCVWEVLLYTEPPLQLPSSVHPNQTDKNPDQPNKQMIN